MKAVKLFVVSLILATTLGQNAQAQRFKLPFGKSKTEANQQQDTNLTQRSGPWLIMCASFAGDEGREQAYRLADELRQKHRLVAYVYSHEFNFAEEVADKGKGWEVIEHGRNAGAVRQMRVKPAGESYTEEFAVLVGDFPAVDDSRAQSTLERIKTMRPETLLSYDPTTDADESTLTGSKLFFAWRDITRQKINERDNKSKGPLRAAFMMPNPTLPDEYFDARKVDHAVIKWNRGTKHSLLKNDSIYTVKVASFVGETTLDQSQIQKKKSEDAWRLKNKKNITESKLVNAAKKATVLADYLRKQGVEAYEFHDRHESYVCVGGFDWLVKTDDQGIERNNPAMVEVIKKFKGSSVNLPGRQGAIRSYRLPDKLVKAKIACDVQPIPVLVPKQAEHSASKLFGRIR